MYRKRFGFTHPPLPKDARRGSFYEGAPGYGYLQRAFAALCEDGGLGILTADAGVGKTASIRNECDRLPSPDYLVLYVCDTAVSPLDLYRTLATELGLTPSHRRAQLWTDIKKVLVHMVDERGTQPIIVIDEAQHLSDRFLVDLAGFLNFAFDSRDLLTMWLVGLPPLVRRLRMHQHAPLAMRVGAHVHLEPLGREDFLALVDHGLKSAGAKERLLSDPALELLVRSSRGVPRIASQILRAAFRAAHERDQSFVDEHILEEVIDHVIFTNPITSRGDRR